MREKTKQTAFAAFEAFWNSYIEHKPLTGKIVLTPDQFEKFAKQFFSLGWKRKCDETNEDVAEFLKARVLASLDCVGKKRLQDMLRELGLEEN